MKANEAPETYHMQFKDKLDEYLWKEHHIISGCSSIESLKYAVAREVAEKLTSAFIDKAEGWLRNNQHGFILTNNDIVDFINYMKGE